MLFRNLKSKFKKGFTIVEAVIGMSVLTFASVLTIQVVTQARQYAATTTMLNNLRTASSNALEIFKFSSNEAEFDMYFKWKHNDITKDEDGMYRYEFNNYSYRMSVHFYNDARTNDSFFATCVKETKTVFTLEYRKVNVDAVKNS